MSEAPGIYLRVDRDGWTGRLQLSIDVVEKDGGGYGRRFCGPKYNGSSKPLLSHRIDEEDAADIRTYLRKVKRLDRLADAMAKADSTNPQVPHGR